MIKKSGFASKASVTHLGGKYFQLNRDLTFYSAERQQGFTAPKGFITDFASIPQPLQGMIGVLGNNIRSAILHDYHCTPAGKEANRVNQKQADDLFREGLKVDQVRWSKARVMYAGVTLFQRVKYTFKKEKYNA